MFYFRLKKLQKKSLDNSSELILKGEGVKIYVACNFLFQLIFVFPLIQIH